MKFIGSGTIPKGSNSMFMEFLRRYLTVLGRAFAFVTISTALVAPVFMVFGSGASPWLLSLSVCTLLAVCASCK